MAQEPFAARLHFIPRGLRGVQNGIVRALRRYFECAPGWVLVTTRGRKTGLPREVLLPCERTPEHMLLISTYGYRSDWIRNMRRDPAVQMTCGGWLVAGRAEIIDDVDRKQSIVSAHPFFPAMPIAPLHAVLRTLLRPLLVLFLRRWVRSRPIVLVHPDRLVTARRQDG